MSSRVAVVNGKFAKLFINLGAHYYAALVNSEIKRTLHANRRYK